MKDRKRYMNVNDKCTKSWKDNLKQYKEKRKVDLKKMTVGVKFVIR